MTSSDFLRYCHLHKPTKRIDQPHLLRAPAPNVQQLRAANQHRQTPRPRNRYVQPVPTEQELQVTRDLLSARRRHREEAHRRLLALELVDGAHPDLVG
jgi:hypothetical protein